VETTSGFIPQSCSFPRVYPTYQLTQLRQSCPPACRRQIRLQGLASGRSRWNAVEDRCIRRACLGSETGRCEADTTAVVCIGESSTSAGHGSVYFIVVYFIVSTTSIEALATWSAVGRKSRSNPAAVLWIQRQCAIVSTATSGCTVSTATTASAVRDSRSNVIVVVDVVGVCVVVATQLRWDTVRRHAEAGRRRRCSRRREKEQLSGLRTISAFIPAPIRRSAHTTPVRTTNKASDAAVNRQ